MPPLDKTEDSAQCSGQGLIVHLRHRLVGARGRPLSLALQEYQPASLLRAVYSGRRGARSHNCIKPPFGYRLGPSHVQRNALLAQPFLASVSKVLAWINATPTKICTTD